MPLHLLNREREDARGLDDAVAAGGRFCGLKAALLSPSLNGYVLGLFAPKSRKTTVINVGALLLALGLLLLEGMPLSPLHSVKSWSIGEGIGKIKMPMSGKAELVGFLVTAALLFQLSAVLRPPATAPLSAPQLPPPPPPAPSA